MLTSQAHVPAKAVAKTKATYLEVSTFTSAINLVAGSDRLCVTGYHRCSSPAGQTDYVAPPSSTQSRLKPATYTRISFYSESTLISPLLPAATRILRRIDDIRHPHARVCVLWLVGQYGSVPGTGTIVEGVADWASDVLRKAARSFNTETLTLAAKLVLLAPTHRTLLLAQHVLTLARYDEDWDMRDRARMLRALPIGAVAGVMGSNDEEGIGGNWNEEQQAGRPGVVLRREQVTRVLFEGKTGTIEEELVADARPLGTLSLVIESEILHLHDGDNDGTVIDLPEWLEQGIDPALHDSDDDAPQVAILPSARWDVPNLYFSQS